MQQRPTVKYSIKHERGAVSVSSENSEIVFQYDDSNIIDFDSAIFAAWAVLPIAMAEGHNVIIDGCGDPVAEQNAAQLSRIWSMWIPSKFAPITLSFSQRAEVRDVVREDMDLLLFSGGVDSCFNLLRRHDAGLRQGLLTIHGLDYKSHDEKRFQELLRKTDPIAALTASERFVIKTNAYRNYKRLRLSSGLTHGFVLAACLFLAGKRFRSGEISADDSRFQEFLGFPWGTNSITNEYFASADYRMNTACLDVTRTQKMGQLIKSPEALASLSFCKTYSMRPNNCGVCRKCIRTKLMFLMECGEIPEIFSDSIIDSKSLNVINFKKNYDNLVILDLIDYARRNNTLHLMPELEAKYQRVANPGVLQKLGNLIFR
jgi:hypothetical protein